MKFHIWDGHKHGRRFVFKKSMTSVANRELYLRVWASDIWRGIGQRTHCFASCHLLPIVRQYNGLQPMLLYLSVTNKKTLIDISEPAMWHEDFCHFNISMWVRRLHWRLITFKTLFHLGPNLITFSSLWHSERFNLGFQHPTTLNRTATI